jgi:hypothetical protein
MRLINLIAPPGSGKSTGASYLFSRMKLDGYSAELVTEYAKSKVYEGSQAVLRNQVYVMAKQYKTIKDLEQYGVKNVVTDSPLMLGHYYGRDLPYFQEYMALVTQLYGEFDNYNVGIDRVKPYVEAGRNQKEHESDAIGEYLKANLSFDVRIKGDIQGYNSVYELMSSTGILVKS